ncbi:mitochondrial carrier domain-containing protein [Gorgonomyces haynaldii]|nr:mitochondrial carrier domain-containing protein [Gorgonomyces haynaldii]
MVEKKKLDWRNLAVGAGIQVFEVSTLGQPFEVIKTHMAANRKESLSSSVRTIYTKNGISGFWRGLIPWAWIEASTKGAILLFTSSEVEYRAVNAGLGKSFSGILGGMVGGVAQAYTTMGFSTFMKTVEVTRHRATGPQQSTYAIAYDILKREGIKGINKGVNAVALRQLTNWGSRLGIARITESTILELRPVDQRNKKLTTGERLIASIVGGALACWNQPIEVIRVEMQSQVKDPNRPAKMTIASTAKMIYKSNGLRGFYRGVTPRIGLSVYLTVCMVFGGDTVKQYFANQDKK